jgi:hypothetical protein
VSILYFVPGSVTHKGCLSFWFRIQLHNETRMKQIAAWRALVLDYHRIRKQYLLDVREAQRAPVFNNTSIDSILSSLLFVRYEGIYRLKLRENKMQCFFTTLSSLVTSGIRSVCSRYTYCLVSGIGPNSF